MDNLNEVKLGNLAYEVSERVANPSESGYERFVGLEHLDSGSFYVNRWGSTSDVKSAMKLFKKGDILFARRNTYLKRVSIAEFDGVCSGDIIVLREYESTIKGITLLIMNLDKFWDFTISNSAGTMSKRAKWRDIYNFNVSISTGETNIKQYIDTLIKLEELIQFKYKQLNNTSNYRDRLLENLLTYGTKKDKLKKTKIGFIPESWDIYTLNELLEAKVILGHLDGNHGGLYPRSHEFVDHGVPYISANNISGNRIDFSSVKYLTEQRANNMKKGIAKNNDVLFAHNATVGPVAILKTKCDYVILSTSLTYYRVNEKYMNNKFLMYYMQSKTFKKQYERTMTQTTRSQVPITKQRTFKFIVPNLEEQDKIVEIINYIDKCMDDLSHEIDDLKLLKLSLLNKSEYIN